MATTTTPDITSQSLNSGVLRPVIHLDTIASESLNSGAILAAISTPKTGGTSLNSSALRSIIHHPILSSSINSSIVRSIVHLKAITSQSLNYGVVAAGIGEAPCIITVAEYMIRLGKMLDDPDHIYYTEAEILHALNRAERLFCFLTLCYEKTVSFVLTNGQNYYDISDQISDFLVPLRVSHSGTRLSPDTLHTLDLRDSTWRARAGNPKRYVQQGFNKLWITPQPASGSHTLSLTYAAEPPAMVANGDVPTIPGEQQVHLQDAAYYFLRMPEGSAELQAAIPYLQRFVEAAQKYRRFTLARSKGQAYDRMPMDLERFDRGSLEIRLARQRQMVKKQKEEQGS